MQNSKEIRELISHWRELFKKQKYPSNSTFGNYKIEDNEIVHTSKELVLYPFMLDNNGELLLKIKSCNKLNIVDMEYKLNSFKNFPEIIYGPNERFFDNGIDVAYTTEKNIPLEGITREFRHSCSFYKFPNTNLSGIHKHIKFVGNYFSINPSYKNPILGVLLIKGIKTFSMSNVAGNIADILNKHYKADGSGDVLECQEELIENGYKQFAKL